MFVPTIPPVDSPVTRWMLGELKRLAQENEAPKEIITLKQLHAAPARFGDGVVAFADGVSWNPGSGEGIYTFYNSTWNV